jgi:transcriptional repressor NrdR
MRCPLCSADGTRVVDSRPADRGAAIRRRRRCVECGHRFTTYERSALNIRVRKRDGSLEPFDSRKIRRGVEAALADRPVASETIDQLVSRVEVMAAAEGSEVSADEIGRVVLAGLREVDEVAYLRFVSVYKEFAGAEDFEREMAALEDEA